MTDPDWVVVVTEILLSLLSKSSHLLRTVVDNVFKMICPHLTKEALGLLLNVSTKIKIILSEDMPPDFSMTIFIKY